MKKLKVSISFVIMLCLISVLFAGCKSENAVKWKEPTDFNVADSATVAENDNYVLSWDSDEFAVILENKQNGDIWSTVPYEFLSKDETDQSLNSPISIEYYNPSDGSRMSATALTDCMEFGNCSVDLKDNAVNMEFYFDVPEITVPLTISLEEQGIRAKIDSSKISESGKTNLISVTVLPYLCSTPNSADKSNYLFVPAGSGALMYTDGDVQDYVRLYTGEVYGTDAARKLLDTTTKEEPIRLPVFGVKSGNKALFSIIESNEGAASITGDAGNMRNDFSTAYAKFNIRGYDEIEVERTNFSDALLFSADFNREATYEIVYYPLSGEKADYNGMADFYKNYLKEKGGLKDSETKQTSYQVNFLGGSQVRDVAVGVPYTRFEDVTTFEEAQKILKELIKETGKAPTVRLEGYQEDGLEMGRIAGGFKFASDLGGKKGYKKLLEYCKGEGVSLFTEYDIIRFNKGANGYSMLFDVAKTAGNQLASTYPITKNTRTKDEEKKKVALLERALIGDALDKLLDKTDDVSSISLSSLGSVAYSDFAEKDYYNKGNIQTQIQAVIKSALKAGKEVSVGAANGYAAAVADSITDVPLTNGNYFGLDETVPFYQMVFHGYSSMYSTPVNLSENPVELVLRAVESGVSPAFTLSARSSTELTYSDSNKYYGSVYAGNKTSIINYVGNTAEYFSLIGDKTIKAHQIIADGVAKTTFSDDISVTVNYGDGAVVCDGISIPPRSFAYVQSGETKVCELNNGGEEW